MTDKISKVVPLGIILGAVIGVVLGVVIPNFMLAIDFIGRLFVNALQVVVIPLILAAVISGLSSFGNLTKIGRTGVRILLYFLATSAIAVVVGLVLALIIRPGSGSAPELMQRFSTGGGYPIGNISDMLAALIPSNLAAGIVKGQYLGLILFAIIGGGLLASMGAGARTVTTFFRQLNDVLMKLVSLVLYAAPIGILCLVGSAVAENRDSLQALASGFGWYTLTILVGLAIQAIVVLPIIAVRFAGRSPFEYLRSLSPALLTALGTGSSAATLPVTYKCAVEEGKADARASALVLPLGAVANLNGTALSVVVATIFLANVMNVPLGALQIILVTVTALLVSIGAAGVPMATPIVASIVLGVAGFTPTQIVAGTGLIMALDWLIDRARAFVNVWGDAVGAVVIAETFEFKTARRAAPRKSDSRRDSARPSRGRTRGDDDRDRRRGRQDSRDNRKPARSASPGRSNRGRTQPRQADADSPFGISAPATPVLDIEAGSSAPKEASRPEAPRERQPQRGRSRDDSSRSSGPPRQKEQPSSDRDRDRGRSRRTSERDSSDNQRSNRRPPSRDRKPAPRKSEDTHPAPRRETREEAPVETEPKVIAEVKEPVVEEPKATPEPAISDGRLSPATVARELAKVSAQLAGGQREPDDEQKPAEGTLETGEPERAKDKPSVKETPDETSEDRRERSFPRSNVAVKASVPPPAEEDQRERSPEGKTEETAPKPVEKKAPSTETTKPHFGRSRSRKGAKPSADRTSRPTESKTTTELPSGYSTEKATFGRGKRKKVR